MTSIRMLPDFMMVALCSSPINSFRAFWTANGDSFSSPVLCSAVADMTKNLSKFSVDVVASVSLGILSFRLVSLVKVAVVFFLESIW